MNVWITGKDTIRNMDRGRADWLLSTTTTSKTGQKGNKEGEIPELPVLNSIKL